MSNELATKLTQDLSTIEKVMVEGDLSKLSSEERVLYYKTVCESVGLNPYTRPFDYIRLNGKLTLYARKDATDQLRKIYGVSIDDCSREIVDGLIIATAKGRDATGRCDTEIGVVAKNDMGGNLANALMKANTKAKRRLTLSLCGLGWLDETEIETIPQAQAEVITVDDSGNIVEQARIESKAVVVENPNNNTPVEEKPAEAPQKPKFDEDKFLSEFVRDDTLPYITPAEARKIVDSKGNSYGDLSTEDLLKRIYGCEKGLKKLDLTEDQKAMYLHKLGAIHTVLSDRKAKRNIKPVEVQNEG